MRGILGRNDVNGDENRNSSGMEAESTYVYNTFNISMQGVRNAECCKVKARVVYASGLRY